MVIWYTDSWCCSVPKLRRLTGGVPQRPFHHWSHPGPPGGHFFHSMFQPCCLRLMARNTSKSSQFDNVLWSQRAKEGWAITAGPYTLIIQAWGNGLKIKTNGDQLDDITDPRLLMAGFFRCIQMVLKLGWRRELRLTAVLSTDVMPNKIKRIGSLFEFFFLLQLLKNVLNTGLISLLFYSHRIWFDLLHFL